MPDKNASSHDKGNLAGTIAGAVAGSELANKAGLGQIGGIAASILGSNQGGKLENGAKNEIDKKWVSPGLLQTIVCVYVSKYYKRMFI